MKNDYRDVAVRYNRCLRDGAFEQALDALREMSVIRCDEGCDADEMKLLMLAFYIGVSGCAGEPRIEAWIVDAVQKNIERNKDRPWDVISRQTYLDTVRKDTTPPHIMSVNDSRLLFEMVTAGCAQDAENALRRFAVSAEK